MFTQLITNGYLFLDVFFSKKFSIFDSPAFASFHRRITERARERPEIALPEVDGKTTTREQVLALCKKTPVVVRGALSESGSVKHWADAKWWMDSYKDELLLCTSPNDTRSATVDEFIKSNRGLYVQGATALFERRPELKEMVESDITRLVAPGEQGKVPEFYQLFMGWKSQGSTVHCAFGLNVFRQVAGRKLWYFLPPSQTPYVYPKIYENGFSCTSKTVQHHARGTGASWFKKLKRYKTILEPGDVLIVPPWWWHCVENLGGADELVIGVATRYGEPKAAVRHDLFKTFITVLKATGLRGADRDPDSLAAALDFEEKLAGNRNMTGQMLTLQDEQGPSMVMPVAVAQAEHA